MKIFNGFNSEGPACPVCKTCDDKPCALFPIAGTNDGSLTYEAKAIHIDCLDLLYYLATDDRVYTDVLIQKIEGGEHERN